MVNKDIVIFDFKSSFQESISFMLNEEELTTISFYYNAEHCIFKAHDYFACLTLVRDFFWKKNKKVICNGARYDVYPSGMLSQMSKGLKVYQLKIGTKSGLNDIVETFASAELEKIGSLSDQEDFYKRWLESLR